MQTLLIALSLFLQAQTATTFRLYPVNDSARDPAFRSFVKRLQSAVTARNTKALRKLTDEDIVFGPGKEDKGWLKFAGLWHPEDENSELWSALDDMLSLGFVREHPSLFLSPYVVWRFPRELNRAEYLVVIRDQAALRTQPSVRAPLSASLSFDIVQLTGPPATGEDASRWMPVRTLDGKPGYVNVRDVMSPAIPRGQFGLRRGKWMLIALEGQ